MTRSDRTLGTAFAALLLAGTMMVPAPALAQNKQQRDRANEQFRDTRDDARAAYEAELEDLRQQRLRELRRSENLEQDAQIWAKYERRIVNAREDRNEELRQARESREDRLDRQDDRADRRTRDDDDQTRGEARQDRREERQEARQDRREDGQGGQQRQGVPARGYSDVWRPGAVGIDRNGDGIPDVWVQ